MRIFNESNRKSGKRNLIVDGLGLVTLAAFYYYLFALSSIGG
ncbi:hypothetical protein [Salipaludibacillus aurantiacus]|uniref:Uncharacterized protein n=1 Tax=Salipaludibacillus aurantiacus TaxID=1601833 RepID=A0A1H9U192_9BACI|nr:hypothetical protein [Salipaludibacillus aurantiacus]SES03216.1 hypothetical protein SAMN05518684_106234 [Salipaludibacillus aurantiacus]